MTQLNIHSIVIDPAWYINIGATDHVYSNTQELNLDEEYKWDDNLQLGNSNQLSISHVRSSYQSNLKL